MNASRLPATLRPLRGAGTALAVISALLISRPAASGVVVGSELGVGDVEAGRGNGPALELAHDTYGYVALFGDARVPHSTERQILLIRLDALGHPVSEPVLVTSHPGGSASVGVTGEGVLVFRTAPAGVGHAVEVALVLEDGLLGGARAIEGLEAVPLGPHCFEDSCASLVGGSVVELDWRRGLAGSPFDVAADQPFVAGPLGALSGIAEGYVVVREGTVDAGDFLFGAALDFGRVVRTQFAPFEPLPAYPGEARMTAGEDSYLFTFSRAGFGSEPTSGTRFVLLDQNGRVALPSGELDPTALYGWDAIWAGGAYRLLTGGLTPTYRSISREGVADAPTELAIDANRSIRITSLASDGGFVLAGLGDSSSGIPTAATETARPNLARIGLDGGVLELGTIGVRPSQQAFAALEAGEDSFLVAYAEYDGATGVALGFGFLDAEGSSFAAAGAVPRVEADSQRLPSPVLSALPDGEGFLASLMGSSWLIDSDGAATPLSFPAASAEFVGPAIAGLGGVVLLLSEHFGSCGEDCGWREVGGQRFLLDGTPLDEGLLFGPFEERPSSSRSQPRALWDGERFVVVAPNSWGLEFLAVPAEGPLTDGWQPLPSEGDSVRSLALARHDGTTLVAWTHSEGIAVLRLDRQGQIDTLPRRLATSDEPTDIAATHDGTRFVVAWQEGGAIRGAQVEPDGSFVQPNGLLLARFDELSHFPALASLGDGRSLVAYHRFDPEPGSLTSRVKARFLEQGAAPLGMGCGVDADCESGFCTGGVCCDTRCDGEAMSCRGAETGAGDGTCAPVRSDLGDGGTPVPPVSCEDDGACPEGFRCDEERLVCIPPEPSLGITRHETGCGCRTGAPAHGRAGIALLLALLGAWFVRRPSHSTVSGSVATSPPKRL